MSRWQGRKNPLYLVTSDPTVAPRPAPESITQAATPAVPAAAKLLTHDQLLGRRAQARTQGRCVVHCHGCFDIVHPGHLRHLRHAKQQGDILLVTITGDSMISKGSGRPLIPQELRAENLAALDCVDWVYIEPRPTAVELLAEVQPDIYVKGREYESNPDPRFQAEKAAVLAHGGRIVFSSGDVVFSSTALIAALEQSADPYHARLRSLLERDELSGESLTSLIASFRNKRVLVVGEVVLDTYVLCDRPDVAGESPIMTLRPVERRSYDGGAAVIARHLAAMGARPVLVTALDRSADSESLRQRLAAEGIEVHAIEVTRPIPEKQRFLVGAQKVMKLDLVQQLEPDTAKQEELLALVSRILHDPKWEVGSGKWDSKAESPTPSGPTPTHTPNPNLGLLSSTSAPSAPPPLPRSSSSLPPSHFPLPTFDAALIADFGLGLITAPLLTRLCPLLRSGARIVSGDVSSKRSHLLHMRAFDLLCPSEQELRESLRLFDESLPAVAYRLLAATHARHAIVTLGPEGLVAFGRLPGFDQPGEWNAKVTQEHVPALSAAAIDSLGSGDSLLAAATLALASDASILAASFLGAAAAGIQVGRLGNTVVSASDLRNAVARLHAAHLTYAPETTAARHASPTLHSALCTLHSPAAAHA